jgi:hypothetical protein
MRQGNFGITPSHVLRFTISSLTTDYIIYRQNFREFNSVAGIVCWSEGSSENKFWVLLLLMIDKQKRWW